ncbi:TIGR03915 family putative DNA repair protein [Tunicatimonas pelagia]|uniref:TIGR03915 family putative DNA repair protein n=1 Tax=Tunicatimonas pelagia TaxID=931531 RepID=UPI002665E64A|nr:TIGR03915 family putative DNA repair protein [Tunicatimonas pelagia]WKN41542.1 TIGR03915 family putative DNA repair protein [Tunicatimonas pelagia]
MVYTYDGSFEGLLSVVFESYRLGAVEEISEESAFQPGLFGEPIFVPTNPEHNQRVKKKLIQQCGSDVVTILYHIFLSEQLQVEMLIYRFVKLAVSSSGNVLNNFREPIILQVHRIKKQIHREVHRMHAFVRFQQTQEGLYAALINPDFNVLPLLPPHFTQRYPAFRWLIYDTKRRYGLYYEPYTARFITLDSSQHQLAPQLLTNAEKEYQQLWRTYFQHVNIPERRNDKLHLQHVPRRYWQFLVEKQEDTSR